MTHQHASPAIPRTAFIGRRLLARSIDWLLAGTVSAVLCWPVAFHALQGVVGDGARSAGFQFLSTRSLDVGDLTQQGVHSARTVLGLTLVAQVLLVGSYELLATMITGTTLGKSLFGLRVISLPGSGRPGFGPSTEAPEVMSRTRRIGRLGRRSALAVLPGGLAVAGLVLAATGSPFGLVLALAGAAVAFLDAAAGLISGRCGHDRWAGTGVVRINWRLPRAQVQSLGRAAATGVEGRFTALRGMRTARSESDSAQE